MVVQSQDSALPRTQLRASTARQILQNRTKKAGTDDSLEHQDLRRKEKPSCKAVCLPRPHYRKTGGSQSRQRSRTHMHVSVST